METGEVELKFRIEHYRVPQWPYGPENPRPGRVLNRLLVRYSRRYGFNFGPGTDPEDYRFLRPQERGGMTIVRLLDDQGNEISRGEARCSFGDNFNYRLGSRIALDRAIKNFVLMHT